jgi:hypothetical protein
VVVQRQIRRLRPAHAEVARADAQVAAQGSMVDRFAELPPQCSRTRPTSLAPAHSRTRASTAAAASDDPLVIRGAASAVLCWLTGRPVPAAADLTASRSGHNCPLPQLRPLVMKPGL